MQLNRKDYTPFPGFYDLRIFNLTPKQFTAAWRIQNYLSFVSKQRAYYKQFAPVQWAQIKELSAHLQMILLPLLKKGEQLRY